MTRNHHQDEFTYTPAMSATPRTGHYVIHEPGRAQPHVCPVSGVKPPMKPALAGSVMLNIIHENISGTRKVASVTLNAEDFRVLSPESDTAEFSHVVYGYTVYVTEDIQLVAQVNGVWAIQDGKLVNAYAETTLQTLLNGKASRCITPVFTANTIRLTFN